MADQARASKMAKRISQIVASALEFEVKDPRLTMVTITDTKVTGELKRGERVDALEAPDTKFVGYGSRSISDRVQLIGRVLLREDCDPIGELCRLECARWSAFRSRRREVVDEGASNAGFSQAAGPDRIVFEG